MPSVRVTKSSAEVYPPHISSDFINNTQPTKNEYSHCDNVTSSKLNPLKVVQLEELKKNNTLDGQITAETNNKNVSFENNNDNVNSKPLTNSIHTKYIFQSPCRSTILKRNRTQILPTLKKTHMRSFNIVRGEDTEVFEKLRLGLKTSKRHMQHTFTDNKHKRANTYPYNRYECIFLLVRIKRYLMIPSFCK